MNRLIIVGNGFDLAHGLPTSYKHFMDKFWESLPSNYKDKSVSKMVFVSEKYEGFLKYGDKSIENYKDLRKNMVEYAKEYHMRFMENSELLLATNFNNRAFEFKNIFFKLITLESIDKWVDIENIYYEVLIGIINPEKKKHQYSGNIDRLNNEFEDIKSSLENYLDANVIKRFNFNKNIKSEENILKYFEIF
tara:strand:- start:2099 stop:2674 length:576 start_codon:yes stop_codon:yes gene_type:complete